MNLRNPREKISVKIREIRARKHLEKSAQIRAICGKTLKFSFRQ